MKVLKTNSHLISPIYMYLLSAFAISNVKVLILENILHWAGVVDELEFAKSLLTWCKYGFPELGDTVGRGVRGVIAKVRDVFAIQYD